MNHCRPVNIGQSALYHLLVWRNAHVFLEHLARDVKMVRARKSLV